MFIEHQLNTRLGNPPEFMVLEGCGGEMGEGGLEQGVGGAIGKEKAVSFSFKSTRERSDVVKCCSQ